ncbi:MAG: protein kinase [Chloroflexota bacterium]
MPLSSGYILNNRYRIVKLLGQGGFGAVYRAWDTNLERPRALKENLETSPEAQRQFKREAQILTDLTHPNLPKVMDYFVLPGQGQYLVMEFVEGEDLESVLERTSGPLPEAQVRVWAEQVCSALSYLHSRQPAIIHRDIKPANIRITPENQAMLVDFGIAKAYDPHSSTTAGARAVTPGYAPHEQYGQGRTDARTDIYALGATLYHLLTGRQPAESIQRMIHDPLPPAERLNPSLSPGMAAAIRRAMQVDPDRRFQSAAELRAALQAGAGGQPVVHAPAPVAARAAAPAAVAPPTPVARRKPPARRSHVVPGLVLAGTLLVILAIGLVLGASYLGIFGSGNTPSPTRTLPEAILTSAAQTAQARLDLTRAVQTSTPALAQTTPSTLTPWPTNTGASNCDLAASGSPVDVTIPDGTIMLPGQQFVKVWRIRNAGACTWSTDYWWIFVSGESMDAPARVPLPKSVAPGESVDISVTLTAPREPGVYRGYWELRNASGVIFGFGPDGMSAAWVSIQVVAATPTRPK